MTVQGAQEERLTWDGCGSGMEQGTQIECPVLSDTCSSGMAAQIHDPT